MQNVFDFSSIENDDLYDDEFEEEFEEVPENKWEKFDKYNYQFERKTHCLSYGNIRNRS